jgi:hypothetical protein
MPRRSGAAWFGPPLLYPASREPVLETGGAQAWVVARGKGSIVQRRTEVTSPGIGRHLTFVSAGSQEPADEVVEAERLGAGQLDGAIHRLVHSDVG